MSKYKVGDRVTVRPDLKEGTRYLQEGEKKAACQATRDMVALAGKEVVISGQTYPNRYHVKGSPRSWTDGMFVDPVKNQKIVTTTDGRTTTARRYSGKTRVGVSEAKCSADDEFNLDTGARLALERLLGEEGTLETKKFTKADLKDGMFCRLSDGSWFVIVGDLCVGEDGMWISLGELRDDLTWEIAGAIDVVVEGVHCFNAARLWNPSSRFVKYIRPGVKM